MSEGSRASTLAASRSKQFKALAVQFRQNRQFFIPYCESLINRAIIENNLFTVDEVNFKIRFSSDTLFIVIYSVLCEVMRRYKRYNNFINNAADAFSRFDGVDIPGAHFFLTQTMSKVVKLVKYTRNRVNPYGIYNLFELHAVLNVIHRVIAEHLENALNRLSELLNVVSIPLDEIKYRFIDIDTRRYSRHRKHKHTPQNIGLNVLIHAYFEPPYDYPFSFETDDLQPEELENAYLRSEILPSVQISLLNFVSFMWLINPFEIQPTFSINRTTNTIRADVWGNEYLREERIKFYNLKRNYLLDYYYDE